MIAARGVAERADERDRESGPARARSPHDGLFRGVFGVPEHAAALLRSVLPERMAARLDLDRLEAYPGSFVNEKLHWLYTDLLFTVPLVGEDRYAYVLVEHQSRPHRSMAYRMLCYMACIWDGYRKDGSHVSELPVVIPVVVHTGRRRWSGPTDLAGMFGLNAAAVRDFEIVLPWFRFLLDDLAVIDEPSLRARRLAALPRIALLLLTSVAGNPRLLDDLYRWSGDFQEILDGPNGVPDLITYLTYIEAVGDVPADELRDLFTDLGPKAEEAYMTTAEQLRTEGRAEGRTEGEALGRADALLDLLDLKFGPLSPDVIDRVHAAPLDQITTWTRRILTAETLSDVLG